MKLCFSLFVYNSFQNFKYLQFKKKIRIESNSLKRIVKSAKIKGINQTKTLKTYFFD